MKLLSSSELFVKAWSGRVRMAAPPSLTVLTSYAHTRVHAQAQHTQLLLLADPSHHPACGEDSSASELLVATRGIVLCPHSFPVNKGLLCLHLSCFPVFSVPPFPHKSSHFSAFCLWDKSFGGVSYFVHLGTRWQAAGRCY